jgi:hypothetical protein
MKTLGKIALPLIALASLAGMTIELLKLMDVGTCASGNTAYVVAQQCPDGTGTSILILTGCIIAFTFSTIAISFSDFGAGAFWFGLLFVVLGGAFVYAALTSDSNGAGVGFIIGPLFLLMGIVPLIMGAREMIDALGEGDDPPPNAAAGLSAQLAGSISSANKMRATTPAIGGPFVPATGVAPAASAVPPATPPAPKKPAKNPPSATEFVEQVAELDKLRQAGALTQAEFTAAKAKLLRGE